MAKIAKAVQTQNTIGPGEEMYELHPAGGLAPKELVQQILGTYRSLGVPLTDPRSRQSVAGLIQSYGYKYDPKWVNGWR